MSLLFNNVQTVFQIIHTAITKKNIILKPQATRFWSSYNTYISFCEWFVGVKKFVAVFLFGLNNVNLKSKFAIKKKTFNGFPKTILTNCFIKLIQTGFHHIARARGVGQFINLKFSLDFSSIDNGETATGSGLKFPLVISTSIKAKVLMGNRIKNKIKYLNIILSL